MSLLWLEPFVFSKTENNVLTFESTNIVIYLNMISVICFVIYSLLYKIALAEFGQVFNTCSLRQFVPQIPVEGSVPGERKYLLSLQ